MSPRIDADRDVRSATVDGVVVPPVGRRLISTAEGTSDHPFTPTDWGLLLIPSLIWGASFLLIAEGLEGFGPGTVTWLRIIFGFLALSTLPASRRTRIDREDRGRVALIGLVWMALPMTMFPLAEQWISSSVTGMLNGSMPLFSAAVAAVLLRRLPGRYQLVGLAVGFVGVVAISLPSLQGGSRTALGAALVVVAMISYGFATNLVVPLQQRYGSVPVIWRAQMVAIVLTAPFGLAGVPESHLAWSPTVAVMVLGAVGTGFAFVAASTLIGRVGATRGSVLAYLIPVVALALGVVFRDEIVEPITLVGLVLVLGGAFLTKSRRALTAPAPVERETVAMTHVQVDLDERTDVRPTTEDGDHEKFAHVVVPASAVTEAYVTGTPVTALCGKTWVPTRDPGRYQVCPTCKEILDAARAFKAGGGGSGGASQP